MAYTPNDTPKERAEGLTRNCLDSMRHALNHFSANYADEYGFHNQKWPIDALKASRSPTLSKSELHAIKDIFAGLEKQRDQLMHRIPPEKLDAEQAALVLLALLYLVRRRIGAGTEELLDGDTQSVFDELGLHGKDGRMDKGGQQRWFEMAKMLAFEDYGPRHLEYCDQCECYTKTPDRGCLACFAE